MKEKYQNEADPTSNIGKSMVLRNLQKQCVSPFSFQKSNNFTNSFVKLNESAMDMLVKNNEPETALDILKQAENELKTSKQNMKEMHLYSTIHSAFSNQNMAANRVNCTHPKTNVPAGKKHNITPQS